MNRRTTGRDGRANLALLTYGSVALPFVRPSSPAAPLISANLAVTVLLMPTPLFGRSVTWRDLGAARTGASRWPVALAVPATAAALAYGREVLMRVSGSASREQHALRDVDAQVLLAVAWHRAVLTPPSRRG